MHTTQTENIKHLFLDHPNEWIPLPTIMPFSAQYNARIFELRRSGMNIINKTQEVEGIKRSWYMYEQVKVEASGQLQFV